MNPTVEYEMTQADMDEILDECKPVAYMVMGGRAPSSQQENANRAWAVLGQKMGFDHMTVRPSSKGKLFFTATPSETGPQLQGCMMKLPDGRWLPEERIREIDIPKQPAQG